MLTLDRHEHVLELHVAVREPSLVHVLQGVRELGEFPVPSDIQAKIEGRRGSSFNPWKTQAKATVDARQTIVDGAVGIVQKAVEKLTEAGIPLGDAEKSKLVTNLLTVICGEKGTQPVLDIGV